MKNILCFKVLLFFIFYSSAQVGIGTTTPDSSTILDVESTSKGILIPRLSSDQINAITNPAHGLMVYNTDLNEFQFNCNTDVAPEWSKISYGSSVKYSNLDISSNLNSNTYTNIPIFGSLDWNDDTTLYSQSGNTLTINTTGRYKITVNIAYTVPNAGSNAHQRVSVAARIAINGTPTGSIANTGYVRRTNNHNEASLHITEIFNITAGQTISIQAIRAGNSAPANFRSVASSNVYIERIK